jgi:hypothetical protein
VVSGGSFGALQVPAGPALESVRWRGRLLGPGCAVAGLRAALAQYVYRCSYSRQWGVPVQVRGLREWAARMLVRPATVDPTARRS